MNQILYTPKLKKYKKKLLYFQFELLLIVLSSLIISLFIGYKNRKKQTVISHLTSKTIQLNDLYQNSNTSITFNNNVIQILGTIIIPKINLSYPILVECSDELLRISVCRFFGPLTPSQGNLCIAGHNYDDGRFFSKLFSLNINDKIIINYNNSNSYVYYVYDIFEVLPDDTKYFSQATRRNI